MNADGFRPAPWLPGRHLQTIFPALVPAPPVAAAWQTRVIPVAPDASLLAAVARPAGRSGGTLLLVHGMGGSADSRYVWWTAGPALDRGWTVVRLNLRNCGGTEALSRTLYNAGQSDDIGAVLRDLQDTGMPRPFAVLGFSLGGNTVLRYAGTEGAGCLADAVCAVNPPVDLDAACRALDRPPNLIYRAYYVRLLCREVARIRKIRPLPAPLLPPWRIRSVRRFDTLYVAPDAGHPSAEAYYAFASSGPHLGSIRVPTLLLSSRNDPFVPVTMYDTFRPSPPSPVRVTLTRQGGHMGYWSREKPRFWAARAVLDHLETLLPAAAS